MNAHTESEVVNLFTAHIIQVVELLYFSVVEVYFAPCSCVLVPLNKGLHLSVLVLIMPFLGLAVFDLSCIKVSFLRNELFHAMLFFSVSKVLCGFTLKKGIMEEAPVKCVSFPLFSSCQMPLFIVEIIDINNISI